MELIAHRGASHDAPENTLAAIQLAWQQGADGTEIDVQLTADGKVVLLHDDDVARTTNNTGRIAELRWAAARSFDAGRWKGATWAGQRIPLLAQVIKTVPADHKLFIEIKCEAGIVGPLRRLIDDAKLCDEQIIFVGAEKEVMSEAKKAFGRNECYWNVDLERFASRSSDASLAEELTRAAASAGLDGLGLRYVPWMDDHFVRCIKKAGQKLFVWTVDDPQEAMRARELGADSLCTNRPGWLRAQLGHV